MNSLSIIATVFRRSPAQIEQFLQSWACQSMPPAEMILVHTPIGTLDDAAIAGLAQMGGAVYIPAPPHDPWSKSRSLNLALRRARARFVLSTDVDCLAHPDLCRALLDAQQANAANALVKTRRFDLPENAPDLFHRPFPLCSPVLRSPVADASRSVLRPPSSLPETSHAAAWAGLARLAAPGPPAASGPCLCAPAWWWRAVRGYDERMSYCGFEDSDIESRARQSGLQETWLPEEGGPWLLHRWHPPTRVPQSWHYFNLHRSSEPTLLRNDEAWGQTRCAGQYSLLRVAVIAPFDGPARPGSEDPLLRAAAIVAEGLCERGHDVTFFAGAGSTWAGRLVAHLPGERLRPYDGDLDAVVLVAHPNGIPAPAAWLCAAVLVSPYDAVRVRVVLAGGGASIHETTGESQGDVFSIPAPSRSPADTQPWFEAREEDGGRRTEDGESGSVGEWDRETVGLQVLNPRLGAYKNVSRAQSPDSSGSAAGARGTEDAGAREALIARCEALCIRSAAI